MLKERGFLVESQMAEFYMWSRGMETERGMEERAEKSQPDQK